MEILREYFLHSSLFYFIYYIPQIVYCCWIAFELVFLYMFVVETKGLSLEETAALFDGEHAEEAVTGVRDVREDVSEKDANEYTPTAELRA
jgi:hypothetical protein